MIRLIQQRLIILKGDTGSFTIPVLNSIDVNDVLIFSIFDPSKHKIIFKKHVVPTEDVINITFSREDTLNLPSGEYAWDIKYYKNPIIEDNEIVDSEEVNSYYAAFTHPVCEVRETPRN